ncbi:MAG: peptidyl-prolyl cis-trans isomerase, partial [Rhodospirillales bacterium]|nr:peptidyl-prolyl cis-trans isomerase [Rhodospirillales bacterium]
YQTVLRSNNMTEPNFLAIVRADLAQRQLMGAVRAPVASPGLLTREVYQFQHETRVAEAVDLPFAAAPPPAAPTAAELKRWYENHLGGYSTPEYRRIRAVVLAPETVAKDITVTDAELHAAYDARKAAFNQPEKRTAEVLLAADEAKAQALAKQWQAGADWAVMQKLATAAGASAVELTDATAAEFPAPELAQAVFAAVPDTVPAPVHSALGWHVLKVTKIIPGVSRSFDEMKDQLRAQIVADKAANRIADAAAKLDDLLSGGAALDTLPTDLGLAAVEGTLDSSGNTPEGKPAPIPGSDALRRALVAAAFAAKPGDPPTLTDGLQAADGSQGYFALEVSKITPPAARPFADVQKEVTADWTHDAVVREQNVAATAILTAVKSGTPFAAAAAGLTVRTLPAASRISGAAGVPSQLVEPLFSLKQGEATMVQTADGFTVAVLTRIDDPDPNADPIGFGQVRDALTKALGDDVQSVLTIALRDRAQPTINKALLDSVTQQSQ